MKMVGELTNVRRDESQVLRDERQSAEVSLDRAKELSARTRRPLARLGGWRPGWDVPGGGELTKMIQPNQIQVSQQRLHAVDAPSVAGPANHLPVIHGVAPELPLGAEIVGRDASDKTSPALFVKQKQLRVSPHVA